MQVVWARMIGPTGRRNSPVGQQDGTVNGSGDGTRRQRDRASWSAIRGVGPRRCGEPNLRLARDPPGAARCAFQNQTSAHQMSGYSEFHDGTAGKPEGKCLSRSDVCAKSQRVSIALSISWRVGSWLG